VRIRIKNRTIANNSKIIGLVLVMASCGGAAGAKPPTWEPPQAIPVFDYPVGRNWRSQLDFLPKFEQDKKIFAIWQNKIASCMADKGHSYNEATFYGDTWADSMNPLDEKVSSVFGYHLPSRYEMSQPQNSDEATFQADLSGSDTETGCASFASESTYRVVEFYSKGIEPILNDLVSSYTDAGMNASRKLVEAWVLCMGSEGITTTSPDQLSAKYSDQASITDEELTIRAIDRKCDVETGLTKSRSIAEAEALESWLASHPVELARARSLKKNFDSELGQMS
jgi:hypothetical protein